ncbi:Eco57I restriction-modification methylase domain-containing protein [Bacillus sp. FJAT-42315]|uniref:Eco57I restriction-modification methylase domain-containing protein n=1 Tax=Bacillus sp. FJAT-42315 TaxID=2014077 RepID=UPI000C231DE5|nr:N-6 DNA methylase [Bacillus sp. FJAT-42315]
MNLKHQIFTPVNIVKKMLDQINYCTNVYGKKVLESACGDGSILIPLVKRYIDLCIKENYTLSQIKKGLEEDIYAIEIDTYYYKKCLHNLNILIKNYGIKSVKWNLYNLDSLRHNWDFKFDYIIGNPPYIRYHDIKTEDREFLRHKYKSCAKGNFDYYYAFIEESINCLSEEGKMVYLIPNNIFKNVYASTLRNIVKEKLTKIYDYTQEKVFSDILTSSAIILIDNTVNNKYLKYYNVFENNSIFVDKSLLGEKWVFSGVGDCKQTKYKFGDYFEASMTIATLLNEAYILKDSIELKDFYVVNEYKIEKSLVREAASPRSLYYKKNEKIIFPYYYEDGELRRYSPKLFETQFPYATQYFKKFEAKLLKRKVSANVYWFEYGRTQALHHLNQPKLLLSTVITKEVKVYELDKYTIPYSGIYITPKSGVGLKVAKVVLESNEFYEYVKSIGINANSNSMRITAKDIKNFPVDEKYLM